MPFQCRIFSLLATLLLTLSAGAAAASPDLDACGEPSWDSPYPDYNTRQALTNGLLPFYWDNGVLGN